MPRHFSHFIRYILNILLVNVQVQISSDNIQGLYKNCAINYRRKVNLKKSTWKCYCQKWKALMKNLNLLSTLFLVYDKSYREVL